MSDEVFFRVFDANKSKMVVSDVRVGLVEIGKMVACDDESSIRIQDIISMLIDREESRRRRGIKTRYPEPLPLSAPARMLSIEVKDYLGDMARRDLRAATIQSSKRTLALLQWVCGDIPVSRIEHKHIYRLWDLLRWAPSGVTSDPAWQDLSVDEVIEKGKTLSVSAPAPATFDRHHRFLSTFFNALVNSNAIPRSPMAAMRPAKHDLVSDPDKAVRLFSDADLQRIFDHKTFVPWAAKHPHRWWGPLIGLYTGARVGEVAQLKVADVVNHGGTWCFEIRKTVDVDLAKNKRTRSRQNLKGKSAIRSIPIMQPLLDAGFLDFVEDIKASGATRLFPHLSAGNNRITGETNGRYSLALLQQFGIYLRGLGIPKQVGFHAFRHTLATSLNDQGVREEDVALITGHSISKNVPVLHSNYYHSKPDLSRQKQLAALILYQPPVKLPVYTKGQFATQLCNKSKFHP